MNTIVTRAEIEQMAADFRRRLGEDMKPQLAITKTTRGHGTYCVRLRLDDGGSLELSCSRELTRDELATALEECAQTIRGQEISGSAIPPDAGGGV